MSSTALLHSQIGNEARILGYIIQVGVAAAIERIVIEQFNRERQRIIADTISPPLTTTQTSPSPPLPPTQPQFNVSKSWIRRQILSHEYSPEQCDRICERIELYISASVMTYVLHSCLLAEHRGTRIVTVNDVRLLAAFSGDLERCHAVR
jgi:hypothetical protein